MLFEDNVELDTLLARAIRLGERMCQVLNGEAEFQLRPEDYDDEATDVATESEVDHAEFEMQFASRKERSGLRRNMRKVKVEMPPRPRLSDDEYAREDFMEAVRAVERNLQLHCRLLCLDIKAWMRRSFHPDLTGPDGSLSEDQLMERLVKFLTALRDQEYLSRRLQSISSAWSVGFSPFGYTDDENRITSDRLVWSDIEALDRR